MWWLTDIQAHTMNSSNFHVTNCLNERGKLIIKKENQVKQEVGGGTLKKKILNWIVRLFTISSLVFLIIQKIEAQISFFI